MCLFYALKRPPFVFSARCTPELRRNMEMWSILLQFASGRNCKVPAGSPASLSGRIRSSYNVARPVSLPPWQGPAVKGRPFMAGCHCWWWSRLNNWCEWNEPLWPASGGIKKKSKGGTPFFRSAFFKAICGFPRKYQINTSNVRAFFCVCCASSTESRKVYARNEQRLKCEWNELLKRWRCVGCGL